jgi:hypothetical protein
VNNILNDKIQYYSSFSVSFNQLVLCNMEKPLTIRAQGDIGSRA